MKQITLELDNPQLLPAVTSFNYTEVKKDILALAEHYKSLVYTDEQIKYAKEDRAALNALAKNISDFRKNATNEYMKPFRQFEEQTKELTTIVEDASRKIGESIRAYEDAKSAEKLKAIRNYFDLITAEYRLAGIINFDKIFHNEWLNATYNIKKVEAEIKELVEQIKKDISVIVNLKSKYELSILDKYLDTYNLADALAENERMALREKEADKIIDNFKGVATETEGVQYEVIDFRIWVTAEQKEKVKQFFKDNNIKVSKVPKEG